MSAVDDLTDIPKTFGIPVETVDGRDVDAVYDVVTRAVEHARARKGPFFVHAVTARYAGTQPLWPTLPTGATDISMALGRLRHGRRARGSGTASTTRCSATRASCSPRATSTRTSLTELDARVRERIAEARQFALDSPRPTPESALDHVFA